VHDIDALLPPATSAHEVTQMNSSRFLLLNLALAFYNVGTIWAHEVDIFRSWTLLDASTFHRVQAGHWHKLPYWVLLPAALALVGSIALIWFHPAGWPLWAISCAVGLSIGSAYPYAGYVG
jgi:hypothetical protein